MSFFSNNLFGEEELLLMQNPYFTTFVKGTPFPPPSTSFIVLEDGTTNIITEDGDLMITEN